MVDGGDEREWIEGDGGGVRKKAPPSRAERESVQLDSQQAHQSSDSPRLVAGEEIRSAAEVQAFRQPMRGSRGSGDRECEGSEREVGAAGDDEHGEAGTSRRQRAHTQHQDRRWRSQAQELLIHHNPPPRVHRRKARDAGNRIIRSRCARRQHERRDLFLRGGPDQVQPQVPG